MKMRKWVKQDDRAEEQIDRIVELSRRRDRLLECPELDLACLAVLAADYEAADLLCAAADLYRRLEWYRKKP